MSASEFDIIGSYFSDISFRDDVELGVGDDAAIVSHQVGSHIVTSVDTLIENVHFPEATCPEDIACKALAVNLSDLAAMGAEPAWLTLALSIPEVDHDWLQRFSSAFRKECEHYGVSLIGGDTTRGALSITINAIGMVAAADALRRASARHGDRIFVSGTLGDAALGLRIVQGELNTADGHYFIMRLNRPVPRVDLGRKLIGISRCAIDISDGIFADLGHILEQSGCAAEVELDSIPLSAEMKAYESSPGAIPIHELMAGDDYELCFTVNENKLDLLEELAVTCEVPITCIGRITEGQGMRLMKAGREVSVQPDGFDHFSR